MENYFEMTLPKAQVDAISNLGLAHMGDCVYELLCRAYLCARGEKKVDRLHAQTIRMVRASAQAQFADKMLELLTEEELAYYRRGKNAHVHAVPKGATPAEYARATGVEALFGALFLLGRKERANEIFNLVMEEDHGL
ncbi:MAG: ribonuclease III domain-containing protein [Firmicutes bacterium]|nr:ribonuclease III domain-containing protein [Bacillota bacterium]